MPDLAPCLMFGGELHGKAEEAIEFYVSVFEDSRIVNIDRHPAGEEELEGKVMRADFVLAGRELIALDGGRDHKFTFTAATSLFVSCDSVDEVDRLFAALSAGGEVLMELGEYPFSPRFAWFNDKYGVSWQVSTNVPLASTASPPGAAGSGG